MPVIVAPTKVGLALVATDCKVPPPFSVTTSLANELLAASKVVVLVELEPLILLILPVASVSLSARLELVSVKAPLIEAVKLDYKSAFTIVPSVMLELFTVIGSALCGLPM